MDPGDHALAWQPQAQEEINAHQQHEVYVWEQARHDARVQVAKVDLLEKPLKEKKKKGCIIM